MAIPTSPEAASAQICQEPSEPHPPTIVAANAVIINPAVNCQRASRMSGTRPLSSLMNIELKAMQVAEASASASETNMISPARSYSKPLSLSRPSVATVPASVIAPVSAMSRTSATGKARVMRSCSLISRVASPRRRSRAR